MPEAVIVATARTPIGRAFKGSLIEERADDMAAFIVDAALKKVPELDRQDGRRPHARLRAPRRRAGLQHGAGSSRSSPGCARCPGCTVTRYCSSLAADDAHGRARGQGRRGRRVHRRRRRGRQPVHGRRQLGPHAEHAEPEVRRRRTSARVARAGRRPGRRGRRPRVCPTSTSTMGETAENVAEIEDVSREEMDEFAFLSQQRCRRRDRPRVLRAGDHAVPVGERHRRDRGRRPAPEHRRSRSSRRSQPAFRPNGRVTAGNACPLNDGAAAVIVMSDTRAERARHHAARADRDDSGVSGLDPEIMGLGPIEASRSRRCSAPG